MNMQITEINAPDFTAIKAKQNAAWSSGDYAKIGVTLQLSGEQLAEAADPVPGARVLDVAAGNGNATLAFARRWCEVTSTDYVPALLERGRARAAAEGFDVTFREADAENLPFADESFDIVTSSFGVMFTPNQSRAASEMIRVCRPGGRIAMANWTPEGFVGQLFKTIGRHVPPPAGVRSPALWGDPDWLGETFGPTAENIRITRRDFAFRYPSVEAFIDFFRTWYGPVHKAFIAVGEDGAAALHADLADLAERMNVAESDMMVVPSEYSEVIVTRA
ncbi:MAG: methyltransferase domain-containing protein [Rhodobiaceae bacterium]|nr:methyltransferase domain-containing protein [Rhodobiaceae bacterium]